MIDKKEKELVDINIKKLKDINFKYIITLNNGDGVFLLWLPLIWYFSIFNFEIKIEDFLFPLFLGGLSFILFANRTRNYLVSRKRYKLFLKQNTLEHESLILEKYTNKKLKRKCNLLGYEYNLNSLIELKKDFEKFEKLEKINKEKKEEILIENK